LEWNRSVGPEDIDMSDEGERAQLVAELERLKQRVAELEAQAAANVDHAPFLDSVLQAVPLFIIRVDHNLRIRYLNRYQPGHTPETTIGRSSFDFLPPDVHELYRVRVEQARETGQVTSYPTRGVLPSGQVAHYETYVAPVHEADGSIGACLAAVDVTVQKRREEELRDVEAKLSLALEGTGLGLWSWNVETGEIVWDEAMRRMHGADPPPSAEVYATNRIHPDDYAGYQKQQQHALRDGVWKPLPYRIVRPDGTIRWVYGIGHGVRDETGKIVKLYGGLLDVTAQRALEEQLRQAQKMEAIGNLTAGVAHNFNNMLTVIVPTLELLGKSVSPERAQLVAEATHAARRAAEMVQQLMTYAGQSLSHERDVQRVDTIVNASVGICRRAFDRRVQLEVAFEGEPPNVLGNSVQLEQVIVNLLLNARDAVIDAGRSESRVLVRVRRTMLTRGPSDVIAQDASHVMPAVAIDVIDNGIGMSDVVRARLFEPFFTTKGAGRGTGLGLATSYAIVRDHEGSITCESVQGVGSTLTITLPTSSEAPRVRSVRPEATDSPGRRVLLIDDEPAVRTTLSYVLSEAGMTVLLAEHGSAALEVLARQSVEVILLDRSMPGGAGETFIARLRALSPRTRILFLSGQMVEPAVAALADGVVQKPVTGPMLLDAIQRVLRSESAVGVSAHAR
jgi:two-component system cell cycle sensor histidine kinase/response regulator CckA